MDTQRGGQLRGGIHARVVGQDLHDGLDHGRVLSVLRGGPGGGGLLSLTQGFGGVGDGVLGDVVVGDIGEKFLVGHGFVSFLAVGRNPYLYLTGISYTIFFILSIKIIRC